MKTAFQSLLEGVPNDKLILGLIKIKPSFAKNILACMLYFNTNEIQIILKRDDSVKMQKIYDKLKKNKWFKGTTDIKEEGTVLFRFNVPKKIQEPLSQISDVNNQKARNIILKWISNE